MASAAMSGKVASSALQVAFKSYMSWCVGWLSAAREKVEGCSGEVGKGFFDVVKVLPQFSCIAWHQIVFPSLNIIKKLANAALHCLQSRSRPQVNADTS